jgi:hypothetical protein
LSSSELQVGIDYALLAGVLWGIGPLLLKGALNIRTVSKAPSVEPKVSVAHIVGLAIYYGESARSILPPGPSGFLPMCP